MSYERLEAEREPRKVADWTDRWLALPEVASVNGVQEERINAFCERKGITLDGLTALGARVATRRGRTCVAFAGMNRDGSRVVAIKYRPVDGSSHESETEKPSAWLRPITAGTLRARDWFVCEGETDAARILDLVGDVAAVLVLPAGACPRFLSRVG